MLIKRLKMKNVYNKKYLLLIGFLASVSSVFAQQMASGFEFVENKGQWDSTVKFRGQTSVGAFFLQANGFTVLLHNPQELQELMHGRHTKQSGQTNDNPVLHSHAYAVRFEGSSQEAAIVPEKVQGAHNNYFIGNDPARWASDCKIYGAVTYKNVYPNIDIRYYSDKGQLKYDLVVHPGGEVSDIAMKVDGAGKLAVKKGELLISTSVGEVKELVPSTYQISAQEQKQVDCRYEITGGDRVRFRVKNYDRRATLVIDPTLIFSTFTGSSSDNWGFSATPGPDGSTFVAGIVFGGGFPVTTGAFQTNFQGGSTQRIDIGIMKLSPDGSNRLYATYLGGSADEYPHSLISDAQGNLIVAGKTYSANYPTSPGGAVGAGGGADIIVTKLNAAGNAIIGSMRIGGSGNDGVNIETQHQTGNHRSVSLIRFYGDESRSEVILDEGGYIYVASSTQSANFPVTPSVFQPAYGGGPQDGVLLKLNPSATALVFASFLGGSKEDGAFVLSLHPFNKTIYVAGGTASSDFPGDKTGVLQGAYQGGIADGFIAVVSNDGSTLIKSTYQGTEQVDIIYGIQFDKKGFPYIMGTTRGSWPVVNAVFVNAGAKQFVSKLLPDLSAYVYSTTFGTSNPLPNISPVAFLVDRCENVYVSGWGGYLFTGSDPYGQAGTAGMPITANAFKSTTDGFDFYFIVIKKNASQLLYATYFGQNGGMVNDHVDGGTSRFDDNGVIHQAICANCGGGAVFPTTPGVWSPGNGTGGKACNLAAVKIAFNYAGVSSGVRSYINGNADTIGCVPLTVTLRDTVRNAQSYEWDFGDSSPVLRTTSYEVPYTFTQPGTYRVQLIAIDSATCNIRDTSYVAIRAGNNKADLAFVAAKLPPCQSLSYSFTNTSAALFGPSMANKTFTWDFGDGTRKTVAGLVSVTHSFPNAGTFRVRLI